MIKFENLMPSFSLVLLILCNYFAIGQSYYVKTYTGFASRPYGICIDNKKNLFLVESNGSMIYRIDSTGKSNYFVGSNLLGDKDTVGSFAKFNNPKALSIDTYGNIIVSDEKNHKIKRVSSLGKVTTIAGNGKSGDIDGMDTFARFSFPYGICVDKNNNIFVADRGNHKIKKISPNGSVVTIAGDGIIGSINGLGLSSRFNHPTSICVDTLGNLYVADQYNNQIRKIDFNGVVSTYAGSSISGNQDGIGILAGFSRPTGISIDKAGNLYVSDLDNHKIRKIFSNAKVTTIAGYGSNGYKDGKASQAKFYYPAGLTVDNDYAIFVADEENYKVRKISICNNIVSKVNYTICQDGEYKFNNSWLSNSGIYFDTLENSEGCDSVVQLNLKINPTSVSFQSQSIVQGNSYQFNGSSLSKPGIYRDTFTNQYGCDSIVILNLSVITSSILENSINNQIEYYFNQGNGILYLKNLSRYLNIKVFRLDGKLVRSENVKDSIDLSALESDIYIIQIENLFIKVPIIR